MKWEIREVKTWEGRFLKDGKDVQNSLWNKEQEIER